MRQFSASRFSPVVTTALWAQRRSWLIPRVLRQAGLSMLSRLQGGPAPVEGWNSPLIVREGMISNSARHAIDLNQAATCLPSRIDRPNRPDRRLSCLISTSVLDAGGIDEFVAFLARRLPDSGIRSTVMVTEPAATGGRLMRALQEEGIEVIHKSPSESPGWLREQRPDVISAHAPPDWLLQAAHELGIPVVETLHAAPTPIGTNWQAEEPRSRNIRFLIAVSDLVRRQYLRGNPAFSADAIHTIPNGFNSTHRQMTDRTAARKWLGLQDEFLFVSLARHVMQKNAYGLLVAFAEVAKLFPHAHLVLAGRADDPVYMKQLQLLHRKIPERHRIHIRDNLSNPSALLSAADCFVLNSFFEGWPLAPMEALCAGLPVVMSDVGGAREQIGLEGRHGHLVPNPLENPETVTWDRVARERFRPQRNRAALVSAMTSIIENREYWTASRAALASEAKVRFNTEACIQRYAQVLEQAVAS